MSDRVDAASAPGRPVVRDDLRGLDGYHSPQVECRVRLNTNESPYPPPQEFFEDLAAAVVDIDWHRYPDRQATELRRAIGSLHDVEPDGVFGANGSNEVLQSLFLAYGGPGRRVAVFEPTYALHSHIPRITGTEVVTGERRDDFTIDPVAACALIERTRPHLVMLCSPNNPTGTVEDPTVIDAVTTAAVDNGALVVVDEAYGQFAPSSALALVDEDLPLVVVRTFSKTWSMAAARLGYLVGPSWVVSALELVVLPYHLAQLTQQAGVLALRSVDQMEKRVDLLVAERERVTTSMADLPVHVWPSGANFLLFRPDDGDGHGVWQRLLDQSVLVRDCSSWDRLDGCLRVTIGTPDENDAFVAALARALE